MASYGSNRMRPAPQHDLDVTYACGCVRRERFGCYERELDRYLADKRVRICEPCELAEKTENAAAILRKIETLQLPPLVRPDGMDDREFAQAVGARDHVIAEIAKMCADPADFFFLRESERLFDHMLAVGGTDAKGWLRMRRKVSRPGSGYLTWWRSSMPNLIV